MKKIFIVIILCVSCNYCLFQKFIRYKKTNIDFDNSYFNLTKEQEKATELFLIAKSQFSLILDYPNIIGIDKDGKFLLLISTKVYTVNVKKINAFGKLTY